MKSYAKLVEKYLNLIEQENIKKVLQQKKLKK